MCYVYVAFFLIGLCGITGLHAVDSHGVTDVSYMLRVASDSSQSKCSLDDSLAISTYVSSCAQAREQYIKKCKDDPYITCEKCGERHIYLADIEEALIHKAFQVIVEGKGHPEDVKEFLRGYLHVLKGSSSACVHAYMLKMAATLKIKCTTCYNAGSWRYQELDITDFEVVSEPFVDETL